METKFDYAAYRFIKNCGGLLDSVAVVGNVFKDDANVIQEITNNVFRAGKDLAVAVVGADFCGKTPWLVELFEIGFQGERLLEPNEIPEFPELEMSILDLGRTVAEVMTAIIPDDDIKDIVDHFRLGLLNGIAEY